MSVAFQRKKQHHAEMSDSLLIAGCGVFAIALALIAARLLRRQPHDRLEPILEREPIFGKDFHQQFYPDLPRAVIYQLREAFARFAGVPTDFVLPSDELGVLAPGSDQAMQEFIVMLVAAQGREVKHADAGPPPRTFDDWVRRAAEAMNLQAPQRT